MTFGTASCDASQGYFGQNRQSQNPDFYNVCATARGILCSSASCLVSTKTLHSTAAMRLWNNFSRLNRCQISKIETKSITEICHCIEFWLKLYQNVQKCIRITKQLFLCIFVASIIFTNIFIRRVVNFSFIAVFCGLVRYGKDNQMEQSTTENCGLAGYGKMRILAV